MLVRMKLDLGCGTTRIEGYTPWDWSTNNDVQFLPFADGSIEEIRASHVLEHIERPYLLEVVQHWVDKLQPGGILRIAVPDFDEIIRLAALDRDQEDQSGKPFPWEGYIMGGQSDSFDQHHTLWNDPKLRSLFNQVGITEILPWKNSEPLDCSDLPISLNLAGRKPCAVGELTQPPKYPDIRGVMTMPRLTWTDTMFCCQKITSALGIEITNSSGVFYGQGMQRILSMHAQDTSIKWALTIDYDSLFDWKDLVAMVEIATRENLDALAPLQSGRERLAPLCVASTNWIPRRINTQDLQQDWFEVSSMHFGLTLIRMDSLRKLPKPWFLATPNANGDWEGDKVDDDIHFWKQTQKANWKIGVTPKVSIGHIETVATWPGPKLQSLHQSTHNYLRSGKPWYVKQREGWRNGPQDQPPEIAPPA